MEPTEVAAIIHGLSVTRRAALPVTVDFDNENRTEDMHEVLEYVLMFVEKMSQGIPSTKRT